MGGITRKNKKSGNESNGPALGAVSFDTTQTLSVQEQQKARSNIDAVSNPQLEVVDTELQLVIASLGDVRKDLGLIYNSAKVVLNG